MPHDASMGMTAAPAIVAGSATFGGKDYKAAITVMRRAAAEP